MLFKISALRGLPLDARDGMIGTIADVLFADDVFTVRWLVVDTGTWLSGRRVLLPASELDRLDRDVAALPVKLTRAQVESSPGEEAHLPVSRQMEADLYRHYGWQPYWPIGAGTAFPPPLAGGAGAWGAMGALAQRRVEADRPAATGPETGDPHLRSAREVIGYSIAAADGEVGHVEDLLLDGDDWTIRHVVVDTVNWWPGRKVMVPISAVRGIVYAERTVRLEMTREAIKAATEYDAG